MPPRGVTWPLDDHSRGKHLVLEGYLKAWLPILGQVHGRIVFIDGFAGPGIYSGGEPGSPVIALRALKDHAHAGLIRAEVRMDFIEQRRDRFEELERQVQSERAGLSPRVIVECHSATFADKVAEILDEVEGPDGAGQLAPCFLMIDPFGVEGLPLSVIRRFMAHQRAEILVSVMVGFIDRFDDGPEFAPHLHALFGDGSWQRCTSLPTQQERFDCILRTYADRLREVGVAQVLRFDLMRGNQLVYTLIHGSKHFRASGKMKEAMWKAAPGGDFRFRGSRHGQLGLELGASFEPLQLQLTAYLAGRDWVPVVELEEWIQSDQTDYCLSHLRKGGLEPLERAGRIAAIVDGRRRGLTYPTVRNARVRLIRLA